MLEKIAILLGVCAVGAYIFAMIFNSLFNDAKRSQQQPRDNDPDAFDPKSVSKRDPKTAAIGHVHDRKPSAHSSLEAPYGAMQYVNLQVRPGKLKAKYEDLGIRFGSKHAKRKAKKKAKKK